MYFPLLSSEESRNQTFAVGSVLKVKAEDRKSNQTSKATGAEANNLQNEHS